MATTTQVNQLPEYMQDYQKFMLDSAQAVASPAQFIPAQQAAPLTPGQTEAVRRGYEGVGSFAPYMQAGTATLGSGIGGYMQAGQALEGAAAQFDPSTQVEAFMDPYREEVIEQQYEDIQRLGNAQLNQANAQAAMAGAYGGDRSAVQTAEIGRNVLDQQARTGGQLRSQGFGQALQAAQSSFEAARNRQLEVSKTMGSLSQGLGQAGIQQAGLGQAAQGAGQSDVNALLSLGGLEQQQAQNVLEAQRTTALQRQMEPYQRVGFLSDVFQGVPTASSATQTTSSPGPSTISQIAGIGLGLAGLNSSGFLGNILS